MAEEIINGEPREPKRKVGNRRLARWHIHSFLIQTFFHRQLDSLVPEDHRAIEASRTLLMSALGTAANFFGGDGLFSLPTFDVWVRTNVAEPPLGLADEIASWLPDELCTLQATGESSKVSEKRVFAAEVAKTFIRELKALIPEYASAQRPPEDDEGGIGSAARDAAGSDLASDTEQHPGLILNVLFDHTCLLKGMLACGSGLGESGTPRHSWVSCWHIRALDDSNGLK